MYLYTLYLFLHFRIRHHDDIKVRLARYDVTSGRLSTSSSHDISVAILWRAFIFDWQTESRKHWKLIPNSIALLLTEETTNYQETCHKSPRSTRDFSWNFIPPKSWSLILSVNSAECTNVGPKQTLYIDNRPR